MSCEWSCRQHSQQLAAAGNRSEGEIQSTHKRASAGLGHKEGVSWTSTLETLAGLGHSLATLPSASAPTALVLQLLLCTSCQPPMLGHLCSRIHKLVELICRLVQHLNISTSQHSTSQHLKPNTRMRVFCMEHRKVDASLDQRVQLQGEVRRNHRTAEPVYGCPQLSARNAAAADRLLHAQVSDQNVMPLVSVLHLLHRRLRIAWQHACVSCCAAPCGRITSWRRARMSMFHKSTAFTSQARIYKPRTLTSMDIRIFDEQSIIDSLEESLRKECYLHLYSDVVSDVVLFSLCDETTQKEICYRLRSVFRAAGSAVLVAGCHPDAIYLVRFGVVQGSRSSAFPSVSLAALNEYICGVLCSAVLECLSAVSWARHSEPVSWPARHK